MKNEKTDDKEQDLTRVRIGTLKLNGTVPNLGEKKTVMLDSEALSEFKRNLAIFATN